MSAGLSLTEAPTSAIPTVSTAAGLRSLLSEPWAVGPPWTADNWRKPPVAPEAWAGASPKRWGAEHHAVTVVRSAEAEWRAPRVDAPGKGPALLAALFAPTADAAGIPVEELRLEQLVGLDSAAHLAALDGRTPRVHPRVPCWFEGATWPATEYSPDVVHGGLCITCTDPQWGPAEVPWFPQSAEPVAGPGCNFGWTPLSEWANRDGWDNYCQRQGKQFERGTEGFRRFEDLGRAWSKGRDALTALACEYVNRLRDESLEEDGWIPPPGPIKPPPPPPKRNLSWR